jgi:hypothetical protein
MAFFVGFIRYIAWACVGSDGRCSFISLSSLYYVGDIKVAVVSRFARAGENLSEIMLCGWPL